MKITDITVQVRNPDRVNISVDGAFRFSLDILQVTDLGIKKDIDYSEEDIALFEQESVFGKVYARALEYCLSRPHSGKELRDYLWKKTRDSYVKSRRTGERKLREGVSTAVTDRVYDRLADKGYIDDERFAKYWAENRSLSKGASKRKLVSELRSKGVDQVIIDRALSDSERDDKDELRKIIGKKQSRYPDEQKLKQYLMRQGFSFSDINDVLTDLAQDETENETD